MLFAVFGSWGGFGAEAEGEAVRLLPNHGDASSAGASLSR